MMFAFSEKDIVLSGISLLSIASILLTYNIVNVALVTGSVTTYPPLPYHVGAPADPRTLTVKNDSLVRLLVQETVRYNYSNPEAEREGAKTFPSGSGSFRLDEDGRRAVFVSMFHQLHCVETFGKELIATDPSHWGHIHHCINFLRAMALCRPDLTLEPGDFMTRDFKVERSGGVHVCRDWKGIHDTLNSDWVKWSRYLSKHPELKEQVKKNAHPPEHQQHN